jgi:hypothetical protein
VTECTGQRGESLRQKIEVRGCPAGQIHCAAEPVHEGRQAETVTDDVRAAEKTPLTAERLLGRV